MEDWKNLQDNPDISDLEGLELAKFRLHREGCINYHDVRMNDEQLHKRRMYLRKVLAVYPAWENLSNDALNDIRLESVGSGYLVEDSKGYEFLLRSNRITPEETDFRRKRAMIPFEFIGLTGKDFIWEKYKADASDQKNFITSYIMKYPKYRDRGVGLYIFSGTKGSGKTMLACILLNEISKRYTGSVKYVGVLDFLEMTKKGFRNEDEDLNAIREAGLLVLDDIGVQMSREWVETVLYRLIDHRYTQRLPTIYTSNISIDGLKVDDRITDRIDCTTLPVNLPEESIRKYTRQAEKKRLAEEIENAP